MIALPGRIIVQKISLLVCWVAYALMIFIFAVIAHDQFRDRRLLETEAKVESTIVTVRPEKSGSWGAIRYRLPDGSSCYDWTELAPNGIVRPGEPLTVAVGQTCRHSSSTKKRLMPWVYLGLCVGGVVYLLNVIWKVSRGQIASECVRLGSGS